MLIDYIIDDPKNTTILKREQIKQVMVSVLQLEKTVIEFKTYFCDGDINTVEKVNKCFEVIKNILVVNQEVDVRQKMKQKVRDAIRSVMPNGFEAPVKEISLASAYDVNQIQQQQKKVVQQRKAHLSSHDEEIKVPEIKEEPEVPIPDLLKPVESELTHDKFSKQSNEEFAKQLNCFGGKHYTKSIAVSTSLQQLSNVVAQNDMKMNVFEMSQEFPTRKEFPMRQDYPIRQEQRQEFPIRQEFRQEFPIRRQDSPISDNTLLKAFDGVSNSKSKLNFQKNETNMQEIIKSLPSSRESSATPEKKHEQKKPFKQLELKNSKDTADYLKKQLRKPRIRDTPFYQVQKDNEMINKNTIHMYISLGKEINKYTQEPQYEEIKSKTEFIKYAMSEFQVSENIANRYFLLPQQFKALFKLYHPDYNLLIDTSEELLQKKMPADEARKYLIGKFRSNILSGNWMTDLFGCYVDLCELCKHPSYRTESHNNYAIYDHYRMYHKFDEKTGIMIQKSPYFLQRWRKMSDPSIIICPVGCGFQCQIINQKVVYTQGRNYQEKLIYNYDQQQQDYNDPNDMMELNRMEDLNRKVEKMLARKFQDPEVMKNFLRHFVNEHGDYELLQHGLSLPYVKHLCGVKVIKKCDYVHLEIEQKDSELTIAQ